MVRQTMTAMLVVCLLLSGASLARGDSITFDYTKGLATTIFSGNPSQSYGDLPILYSDQSDRYFEKKRSGETQALIYFDIFGSGLGEIPLGSTITNAMLRFYEYNGSWNPRDVYRMTSQWDQSSSWASLGGGVKPGEKALASPDVVYRNDNPGNFFGIDVTPSLQAWAEGGANLGWAIVSQGTDGSDYASFLNSNVNLRPTLTVEYTSPSAAAPEPGTFMLVALSMGCLWRLRRRLGRV